MSTYDRSKYAATFADNPICAHCPHTWAVHFVDDGGCAGGNQCGCAGFRRKVTTDHLPISGDDDRCARCGVSESGNPEFWAYPCDPSRAVMGGNE